MSKRIPVITKTITQKQVTAFLQPRPLDSHKGMFGTVLVIGGDSGMVGAALLAGRAALKLGAGCVHVGLLAENAPKAGKPDAELSPPAVDMVQPELMLHHAHDALSHVKADVLAVGCGMGTSIAAQKFLHAMLRLDVALVLDADALNLIAKHPDLQDDVRGRKAATIITPHPGEAARLLGIGTAEIQSARTAAAAQLAQKLHCSVVLKGADSVCVTRDGKVYLNQTGNPGMSAPGMGDVLTGIIAALIAQGLDADDALLLAVHLHGAAGDTLAQQGVAVGMTATELTEWTRWLINQWHPR